jgi:hypothetical protein
MLNYNLEEILTEDLLVLFSLSPKDENVAQAVLQRDTEELINHYNLLDPKNSGELKYNLALLIMRHFSGLGVHRIEIVYIEHIDLSKEYT